ncbi:MAG: hypothetical protein Q8K72_17025, partial [Acidimicrobiales bacterium]|nr:hypothetical protein [Acidimicrobiales bacterium]
MRVGPALAIALAALVAGACSAGDRTSFDTRETTSTSRSGVPSTTVAPAATTTTTGAPAGSVTLRVSGFSLPDTRAGGTGLRVLVRSSSERLSVSRQGRGGAVSVCPIALATPSPSDGACVDLPADGAVQLAFLYLLFVRLLGGS